MQASGRDGTYRAAQNHAALNTRGVDSDLESKAWLGQLAQRGWIVAVIPDHVTGREHCVEAFLDSGKRLVVRVRPFDLRGEGDTSHSAVKTGKPIALRDIEEKYSGRWVKFFENKRRDMGLIYLEQWLRDPENYETDVNGADILNPKISCWIHIKCMFAPRHQFGSEVWLGDLDHPDQAVDRYESFPTFLTKHRDSITFSVVKSEEWVRPVCLASGVHRQMESGQTPALIWRWPVKSWQGLWILPIMATGSNVGRQFAILKWTKEGGYYALLQANGQLHPDLRAVPLFKSTGVPNPLLGGAGSAGVTASASSSKRIDGLDPKPNSRPLGASLVSQQDSTVTGGSSTPLEESSTAFATGVDGEDCNLDEILTAGSDYWPTMDL